MYLKRTTWLSQVSVIYSLWIPLNAFSFSQIDDKVTFHCSSVMFLSAAIICFDICGLELANICFYYVWMFCHKALAALTLSPGHLYPVDSLPCAVFQYHHCYPSQWEISPYSSFTDLFGHFIIVQEFLLCFIFLVFVKATCFWWFCNSEPHSFFFFF